MRQLHCTLMFSYLNYGILSWGKNYQTRLNKLRTKQNKCMCNIFFADSREHSTPYYNLLEILNFDNIVKFRLLYLHIKFSKRKKFQLYSLTSSSQQQIHTLIKLDILPKKICFEQTFEQTTANLCLDTRQFTSKCGKVSHHTKSPLLNLLLENNVKHFFFPISDIQVDVTVCPLLIVRGRANARQGEAMLQLV